MVITESHVIKKLTPNLMVKDVNCTAEFYRDVLGFEFVMGVPEDGQEIIPALQKDRVLRYAMMKWGDVEIMFQATRSLSDEISAFAGIEVGGSLVLYMEVKDVEGWHAKLRDEVTIVKDLHTTFYGMREFYIRDCNGYVLAFAEEA